MGGGSASGSSSKSSSTTKTTLGNTTTSNPYITSTTTNDGTTTNFQPNTSLSSIYNFTNQNIDQLLNNLLNPSLDTAQNQAKLNNYSRILNEQTRKSLENDIISPLAQRNMIRSSQATDLYNNLAKQQTNAIDDFTTELLSSNQNNAADIINTLMNLTFQGYNMISGNQAQSLDTSLGNATTNTTGKQSTMGYGAGFKYGG